MEQPPDDEVMHAARLKALDDAKDEDVLSELFFWQHGRLPSPEDVHLFSMKAALNKMAEAMAEIDPKRWPNMFTIACVLKYVAKYTKHNESNN
jgi:hypothetical protein